VFVGQATLDIFRKKIVSCTLVTYLRFNCYAIPFGFDISATESITGLGVLVIAGRGTN